MVAGKRHSDDDNAFQADLTASQVVAIQSILAGDSFRDAALNAKVDERTLRRWRSNDTEFEVALRRSHEELRRDLGLRAITGAQKALDTLLEIAGDPSHPRAVSAACRVLELARIGAPENLRISRDEVGVDQLLKFT
jgi:hypothetical protein